MRNVRQLEPCQISKPLHFGSLGHWGLEQWFNGVDKETIFAEVIDRYRSEEVRLQACGRSYDLHVIAALEGYFRRYPKEQDPWEVLDVEVEWRAPLINPATGAASKKFKVGGKMDLLVKGIDGKNWLVEHKFVSNISATQYRCDRLWTNFQGAWYVEHASRALGVEIEGVIFDIVQKSNLKQYQPSKRRPEGETREEFLARLLRDYETPDRLERTKITYTKERMAALNKEVWVIKNNLLMAAREGVDGFYQNPDWCFKYNSACKYYRLCRSDNDEMIARNEYIHCAPNAELGEG